VRRRLETEMSRFRCCSAIVVGVLVGVASLRCVSSPSVPPGEGDAPLPSATGTALAATVPMHLDHARITVEVELERPDGSQRPARAWVDTGGTNVTMAESLATDLGIDSSGPESGERRAVRTNSPVPPMRIGGIALDVEGMQVAVHKSRFALPGIDAELVLPARSLRKLHVAFDYPARRLTVAAPGALKPLGVSVPCSVNPETGLFMVEVTIDGESLPFGVDTGSAGTWVSEAKTEEWSTRHPDWRRSVGAAGSTNFFGFPFETEGTLMSLPAMKIGSVPVDRETAVLGLSGTLFDWYSKKSAGSVVGFLGGDVLEGYRLEVDFPAQTSWWSVGARRPARDLDIVGLTLRPGADGSYTVAGVVSRNGVPAVEGVLPGDKLLRVGSLTVEGATMGTVVDALRGEPGDFRTLVLERDGKEIEVRALVSRLP